MNEIDVLKKNQKLDLETLFKKVKVDKKFIKI